MSLNVLIFLNQVRCSWLFSVRVCLGCPHRMVVSRCLYYVSSYFLTSVSLMSPLQAFHFFHFFQHFPHVMLYGEGRSAGECYCVCHFPTYFWSNFSKFNCYEGRRIITPYSPKSLSSCFMNQSLLAAT
jgi:hypothetical protein